MGSVPSAWIEQGREHSGRALYQRDRYHVAREVREALGHVEELRKVALRALAADDVASPAGGGHRAGGVAAQEHGAKRVLLAAPLAKLSDKPPWATWWTCWPRMAPGPRWSVI